MAFTCLGRPQQRGSKQPIAIMRGGQPVLRENGYPMFAVKDDNEKSGPWMGEVRAAAAKVFSGDLLLGPIRFSAVFHFKRPASHFGTGRNAGTIKVSSPWFYTSTPDLDKLVRCAADSLTGVVYADDKQICEFGRIEKRWTTESERAEIVVEELVS